MDLPKHQEAVWAKLSRRTSPKRNILQLQFIGILSLLFCVSVTTTTATTTTTTTGVAAAAAKAVPSGVGIKPSNNTSLRNIEDENGT